MAVTTGLTGAVASWAGTFNAAMLALIKPATFSMNNPGIALDTTGFTVGNAGVVKTKIPGLRSWSGSIGGYLATPATGILGNLSTSGSEYVANVRAWDMSLTCDVIGSGGEATGFNPTGGWMDMYPGLVTAGGSFECMVDSSTALTLATAAGASLSTLTFTITTGQTLACSAIITAADITETIGQLNVIKFNYEATGHVTVVGSSNVIPAAVAQATPVAGSLVLTVSEQGASDKQLSGSAFWTKIGVKVSPGTVTAVDIGFQGSGALTPA